MFCEKSGYNKFAECLKQIDIKSEEQIFFILEKMISFNYISNINSKLVIGAITQITLIVNLLENVLKSKKKKEGSSNQILLEIDSKLKNYKMEESIYM